MKENSASNNHSDFTRQTIELKKERTDNSGFKKLAVQWLNEHSTSHQHLWWQTVLCSEIANFLNPQNVIGNFWGQC